ncbi:hypothetical protein AVEN_228357-1 [Araneus ventricosus]|uniref:Uncharacterized protein n=1 Tax=Araneus ventricosus TaxID=182803 RepID=A0A4Y2K649_ARAVE|nr:hypothetical protein AVEN_228357-1 [Araneus ventricosus]
MSALHKGATLKPPSSGLELVDDINDDLDDITEQELEQQEVQNLLIALEPIHDVQLQLDGYTKENDDKGKKRSITICPTTRKRIKKMSDIGDISDTSILSSDKTSDPTFKRETSSEPHFIPQNELNDLVCELGLSKQQAEIFFSRLQEWNLLTGKGQALHVSEKEMLNTQRFTEWKVLCMFVLT